MRSCSVSKKLQIVRGSLEDYEELAHYHYRDNRLGPFVAIYALKHTPTLGLRRQAMGVIVYKMPTSGAELRNVATGDLFAGFDRATQLALLNKNVRCISRVVIDPRYRGLGIAHRLVAETMPLVGVTFVEAMAVMGRVNPFFEKAGMDSYQGKEPLRFPLRR